MRATFLIMGLCCLVGFVYSNEHSNAEDSDNVQLKKSVRIDEDEELDQIVGGSPAAAGEFPFQAALNRSGRFICGGTLISPSIVLTAAHCLAGYSVLVNTLTLNGSTTGSVQRRVRRFAIHPAYNSSTLDNDIALLKLSSPITNVQLATLPTASSSSSFSTYAGDSAVIAGWGTTSFGGRISRTLLKATVNVLDKTACELQYPSLTDNMICAAAPGKDTCQGDSGGPMMVGGVQVGITSFGRGCADPNYAGVYTRVTRFVEWIATISALFSRTPSVVAEQ